MESVNLPPLKSLQTKVVELGTGKTENVLPVQTTGSSTIMEFVSLFLTNARPSIVQEPVFLATLDTTLKMELVFLPQLKLHLMSDVVSGTGTRENALSAQTTGSSTTECVSLSQISAEIMTLQELVFHVMKDTTLSWEDVNLQLLKNLQIKDVELGTGKTKDVFNAPTTGSSITSENVFPSLISARLSIEPELANHAIKDTISLWEDANLLPLKNPLTLDVENGTGMIRSVLNVPTDSFSMLPGNVSPLATIVNNGIPTETVLIATRDTFFKEEFVLKETLSVTNQTLTELVLHVTPDTFLTTEAASQFQSWLPWLFTTHNAVPRSWPNCQEIWEDQLEVMFNSTHDVFADLYLISDRIIQSMTHIN